MKSAWYRFRVFFKRVHVRIAFLAGVILLSASFAHAGAVEDLMAALGMPVATSSETQKEPDIFAAELAQAATSSPQVAAAAATEAEQIESLRKLIVTLMQQLAALFQLKKSAAQTSSISVAEKINAGICGLHRPLSPGVDGEDVKILQRFLVSEGLLDARSVSGSYGPLTEKAVREWQRQSGVVDHGEPYTTGYGLVNKETLSVMQASCLTERTQNRAEENEQGATKDFFVKKVPMTLEMKMGSLEKNMELSYTVKEMAQDPKMLRICWTLESEDNTPLTETDCWSLGSYGTHTEMISSDFSLAPNLEHSLVVGHNVVKLRLELFDPSRVGFDLITHQANSKSLGSDDTGTFDLYVDSAH